MKLFTTCFMATCLITQLFSELTFSMVKPTAVREGHTGAIIAQFEQNGLKVVGLKMAQLSEEKAKLFYQEHEARPFFGDLVKMMSGAPVVAMVLEGEGAVAKVRGIVGATDPSQAAPGTIRARFGKTKQENAVHASDSETAAKREIAIFFSPQEIYVTTP